ncbi:MFS transporter [Pseudomaricurvus alkylphenolicus]|uniref:MFS transporter n=1 Tax=Pseudomaricurvus alkylphenolicus TaxID=1306991 RepID=UPI00142249D9|nr:MFS transporter [Pseudomaricurvus alkylphenolicus]NIB40803.1 MFS transporter [Pseudomaricurvus alkylphenolicus]
MSEHSEGFLKGYLGDRSTRTDVNSTGSIIAIVFLAVIGPCMFILQPAYVQGLVEYMKFSEEQAGLIASAEMFGLATTAIGLNFVLNRFNWRTMAALFLIISAVGNFLSLTLVDATQLSAMRYLTGLGSGGLIGITFVMMGLTQRAERNMGYIIAGVLTYGAIGLLVMPSAFHWVGVAGVLFFFGVFCASGLLFVSQLPCSDQTHHEDAVVDEVTISPFNKWTALGGVLAYNLAIGIVWVYMFLVGVEAGISEQTVANALTVSQFLGIAGAMLAVFLEVRFGRLLPLLFGIIGGAFGIALILGTPTVFLYAAGVCVFNFLWNFTMPYLMATLASYDVRGRVVAIGVALQMLGYAVGPAVAASLLGAGGYDLINSIAIALFMVAAVMLVPGLRAYARSHPTGTASSLA